MLENKNILVVEDSHINQLVAKHILTKLKAQVDVASDGLEAIEKLQSTTFDLILMDVQMPSLNGYDTTKYIRTQLNSNVPIIAMTAFAWEGEDEKCLKAGMDAYISKPFTSEMLFEVIKSTLEPSGQESHSHTLKGNGVEIDLSLVYEVAGDDRSYIQTMVNTFVEKMPPVLADIDQALLVKDYQALYKAAHYAKSSFSVIRIDDVFSCIQKIEQSARHEKDTEALPSLIAYVKEKFLSAEQLLMEKFETTTT